VTAGMIEAAIAQQHNMEGMPAFRAQVSSRP
jgi:hypothetical protein